MGFSRGPKIVTDGLVLALDAGSKKSYPGSGDTWYINGESVGTSTNNSYAGIEISRMVYYGDGSSLGIWPGQYYLGQLYNRALSSQEIQQNYNALKSRFM